MYPSNREQAETYVAITFPAICSSFIFAAGIQQPEKTPLREERVYTSRLQSTIAGKTQRQELDTAGPTKFAVRSIKAKAPTLLFVYLHFCSTFFTLRQKNWAPHSKHGQDKPSTDSKRANMMWTVPQQLLSSWVSLGYGKQHSKSALSPFQCLSLLSHTTPPKYWREWHEGGGVTLAHGCQRFLSNVTLLHTVVLGRRTSPHTDRMQSD